MSTQKNAVIDALTQGKLRIVDLTHAINEHIPAFDSEPGAFVYERLCSVERDGCFAGAFRIEEHFGTHMDAPAHFVQGAATIDKIAADRLVLPAVVIDARREVEENVDYALTLDKVKAFEKTAAIPAQSAVLLMTGWDKRFRSVNKYRNADKDGCMHFPGYSLEAATYLVEQKQVAAFGIDTLSIDVGPSRDYAVHKRALAGDVYFIENLTNLDLLPPSGALIFCGALAIEGGSGSPARVLAVVP